MTRPNIGVADQTGSDGPHLSDVQESDPARLSDLSVMTVSEVTGSEDVSEPLRAGRVSDGAPEPVERPDRVRWRLADLSVAAVYLFVAYLITSKLWVSPSGVTPNVNGTDQAFFEWMLEHAVRIFTHGDNPFFTTQLNYPVGVNLMSNTNLLGLGIPLAPVTALFGPSVTFVLILFLGLSGTAFAWYYVLSRHVVFNRIGAFVGGAVCGFGPGIMTHANGHPNLTAQFVLPFILWRALALAKSVRPIRDGAILGLLIAYQVFLNEELLFLTGLGGTIFVIAYVCFRPAVVRAAYRRVAVGLAASLVVAGVLLAYPIYFQFKGPQHFSGLPDFLRSYPYSMSIQSWVELPTLSLWGQPPGQGTTPPSGTEQNSLLGWLVVLVSVGIVITLWRRRPAVRALAIVGVLFAWASLGEQVVLRDNAGAATSMHQHWSLWVHLSHLPLFDSVLSSRNALVVLPVVGVLFAYAVSDGIKALIPAIEKQRAGLTLGLCAGLAAIVAACVSIAPTPVVSQPRPQVPEFVTSGDWRAYVPAGDSVLSAQPYDSIPFMMWSISQNLDMNVAGGYFLGPAAAAPGQTTAPVGTYGPQWRTTMLVMGSVGAGSWSLPQDDSFYQTSVLPDLKYWHTAIIVLAPGVSNYEASKDAITRLLGIPGKQVDDVWLWDVRSLTK